MYYLRIFLTLLFISGGTVSFGQDTNKAKPVKEPKKSEIKKPAKTDDTVPVKTDRQSRTYKYVEGRQVLVDDQATQNLVHPNDPAVKTTQPQKVK